MQRATVTPAPRDQERFVWTDGTQHRTGFTLFPAPTALTDEGKKLVEKFTAQREAIQKEADAKVASERQASIKELQALQDQYAKAGKLDEAVAIRDYLKAGGPSNAKSYRYSDELHSRRMRSQAGDSSSSLSTRRVTVDVEG